MYRHESTPLDYQIFVCGLMRHSSKEDVERAFGYYAELKNVFVFRNPPSFGLIEFEDLLDAGDAVKSLDGS